MGRYAHRFRAFAVTGSDLASCKEEDLIQIGVSFRYRRSYNAREKVRDWTLVPLNTPEEHKVCFGGNTGSG